jgi:hemolysin III
VAEPRRHTLGEEIAHSVTHGVGAVLSVAGVAVLAAFATLRGNAWHVVSCGIYGATLVLTYTASTVYHAIPASLPRAKGVLQALDHSAIYLLIAGTYTPFALGPLQGPWGWTLLGIVWGLALAGILLEMVPRLRHRRWTIVLYLGMGWLALVALEPLVEAISAGGVALLAAGGLAYTAGVLFYVWRRPFHHAVWHGFVLAGSALHFFCVLFYAIPRPV